MLGDNLEENLKEQLYYKAKRNSEYYKKYATTKQQDSDMHNEHYSIMIDGHLRDLNGYDYMAWEDLIKEQEKNNHIHH